MQSWLILDGDPEGREFSSLTDWLRREDELRVRPRQAAPGPDEMGALWEVLAVAVSGTGALTVLARSLDTWLRQPRRATVTVKVLDTNGKQIELSASNVRSVDEVENLLRECLRPDDQR